MYIFGVGNLYGVPLTDANGNAIANPTPRQFGTLQSIKGDLSFDEKTLFGAYSYPVAFGRGKAKTTFTADIANFDILAMGALYFGQTPSAALLGVSDNEPHQVPAVTTYTVIVAPPNTGVFSNNLGVRYASTGIALTVVAAGSEAAGKYSFNAGTGTYTFAVADASANILISYEYTASSTTAYEMVIANQLMGTAPSFQTELSVPYNGHQLIVKLNNCVSSGLSLPFKNEDFSINQFKWTALVDASGNLGTIAVR